MSGVGVSDGGQFVEKVLARPLGVPLHFQHYLICNKNIGKQPTLRITFLRTLSESNAK